MHAEGRIEPSDGTLMCSYHGWRFQGDGKCTNIPQALDEKSSVAACSSPRSCASTRPTQVRLIATCCWKIASMPRRSSDLAYLSQGTRLL